MAEKIGIAHVITDLDTGGAEMMLCKLVAASNRNRFEHEVVSLTNIGAIGDKIRALGIPVSTLGMKRGAPDPRGVTRLAAILRRRKPDALQTWMYHADLVGGLAAYYTGRIPVAWGVHNSSLEPGKIKRSTILTARVCALLSRSLPERIICCSDAAKNVHARLGYAAEKMIVIPNGFDSMDFRPDPGARDSLRRELGLPSDTALVGLVARFDPQKDHKNFIGAASLVSSRRPDVRFVLCGDKVNRDNCELTGWISAAGLGQECILLGLRDDVPRIMAALDVAALSSCSDAFPNVVGEAMACGVPCAVTGGGGAAFIVGDAGRIAPPRNPAALADAILELIGMEPEQRRELGEAARRRIQENFNLNTVVEKYEKLYSEIAVRRTR
jgi:glycosyltransferase involved in cell wall biosynthesis